MASSGALIEGRIAADLISPVLSRSRFRSAIVPGPGPGHAPVASDGASSYTSPDQNPGKAMTDSDAVLAANLEFYRAFTARDLAAMEMLWAHKVPVACLHPGWTALKDRTTIMESWAGILSNPDAPRVACSMDRCSFTAMSPWCCARKNSTVARSPQATCSSAKTMSGGSPIITPVRSSAGTQRGGARGGSIDGRKPPIEAFRVIICPVRHLQLA